MTAPTTRDEAEEDSVGDLETTGTVAATADNSRVEHFVMLAVGLYAAYFSYLLVLRHERFATYDYDLGLFDQAVWLLSRGESFMSLRGLDFWGHHFEPAMLLFVPFYWLGAGASTLNVAMVASLALGAKPVFDLAKSKLGDERLAAILAMAFLAHYSTQWILQETFHPEVMAVTPMLFAWLAAEERRWKAFAGWVIFAMAWKEDVAMAVAAMGFVLAVRGHRRIGFMTMVGAAAWFGIATELIIPAANGGDIFYGELYGELGSSPSDVALKAITDPVEVGGVLKENHAFGDFRDLLLPFGFMPLLSPLPLLMALPQFVASHLTITAFSLGNRVHYVAMPLFASAVSMVEGVGRLRSSWRPWAVGVVAASALASSAAWGVTPFSVENDTAIWWQGENSRQALLEHAVAMVPEQASVSATYSFAPKMAHRRDVYGFPNPWRSTNWAVDPDDLPDPSTIDWLVLDFYHLGEDGRADLDRIFAAEDWEIVLSQDNVVVARRSN